MSKDPTELVVAGTGTVWVHDLGEALPAELSTDLAAAGWTDVGYTTEDGVMLAATKETQEIRAWQSKYPIRRIVDAAEARIEFKLQQWNEVTLPMAFGGGTIADTPTGGGLKQYNIPVDQQVVYKAAVLEIVDGAAVWRVCFDRVAVTGSGETQFTRTAEAGLPMTLTAEPASGAATTLGKILAPSGALG